MDRPKWKNEGHSIVATKVTITLTLCEYEALRLIDLLDNYYGEPDDDNREAVAHFVEALVQGALVKNELDYTIQGGVTK